MGKTHVADPRFEQDPENGAVHIEADVAGALLDEQLRATALFEDVMPCSLHSLNIVETQVGARKSESVRPGTAALDDGTTADAIESYFGLRSVTMGDEAVVFSTGSVTSPMGHRVTVWNEYRHERENDVLAEVYPNGIHTVIADALAATGHDVDTATLDDDPQHGLTDDLLEKTDVLTWWGHAAHDEVNDEVVERVQEHVLNGMGCWCSTRRTCQRYFES